MKIELLAPAKNKECAFAAINYGADALYIGANSFGARKSAGNSLEDLEEIINYAHKFYVKVYCTINTILTDDEIEASARLIEKLYDLNADGIIIQDMGILELAIEGKLPPIPLFASTQCDNRNLEKVKFFENIGLSRVILARELSLKEIEEICKNTELEIETFVHGALCVSYSGQCYLSQSIGGRSANRGECAQPCRKKYSLVDDKGKILAENKHLLSLKDFNASEYLEKLVNSGVSSFKIEGRLKDEGYIKNVVAYYRQKLDEISEKTSSGQIFYDFTPDVQKSFNRGFCDYFLQKRGKIFNFETPKSMGEKIGKIQEVKNDHFVINNHDLHAQDGLFFNNTGCLVNKVIGNKIYPNRMDGITVGTTIYRNLDVEFEKKLKTSKTKRQIKVEFKFLENRIEAIDEDKNVAEIEFSAEEQAKNVEKMKEVIKKQLQKTGESDFFCEKIAIETENIPFLAISQLNELRRDLLNKLMTERLKNYPKSTQKPLSYANYPESNLDFSANIHNKLAEKFYENCGCKVLDCSIESSGNIENKPLMTTKHCLKYAFNLCKKPVKLFLIDEKSQKYRLNFDCKNCRMEIFKA